MVRLVEIRRRVGRLTPVAAALVLGACAQNGFDFDLRSPVNGFSTREAARTDAAPRPRPDSRGVISYPGYEVVVARPGDTVGSIAERLQIQSSVLARFNALTPETTLRAGEILALPSDAGRVGEDTVRIASLAEGAIERSGAGTRADSGPSSSEPVRHQVRRGETAFTIARLYNVSPRALADWNGLDPEMNVREGQYLLVPVVLPGSAPQPPAASGPGEISSAPLPFGVEDSAASVVSATPPPPAAPEPQARVSESVTAPGSGSATPVPPSASRPLPDADAAPAEQRAEQIAAATPPSPDLAQERSASTATRLSMPVDGRVIRAYSPGRNEGIGIAASAGTAVRAAAAGTVAAITQDTNGVPIVVIRHEGTLLTVYANLDNLRVQANARVTSGQTIADVRAGDPSFLHFEVRDGMSSVDPMTMLQ